MKYKHERAHTAKNERTETLQHSSGCSGRERKGKTSSPAARMNQTTHGTSCVRGQGSAIKTGMAEFMLDRMCTDGQLVWYLAGSDPRGSSMMLWPWAGSGWCCFSRVSPLPSLAQLSSRPRGHASGGREESPIERQLGTTQTPCVATDGIGVASARRVTQT